LGATRGEWSGVEFDKVKGDLLALKSPFS